MNFAQGLDAFWACVKISCRQLAFVCILLNFCFWVSIPCTGERAFAVSWLQAVFRAGGIELPGWTVNLLFQKTVDLVSAEPPLSFEALLNRAVEDNLGSSAGFPHLCVNPLAETCPFCVNATSLEWDVRKDRQFNEPVLYTFTQGPRAVRSYFKRCNKCNIDFYSSHFCRLNGKRGAQASIYHYNCPDHSPEGLFASTTQTYFNDQFLVSVNAKITSSQLSFREYTSWYNETFLHTFQREKRLNWVNHLDSVEGRWLLYEGLCTTFHPDACARLHFVSFSNWC